MRKSTTTWILTGSAVVLVAASAVTRFTVYPALHQVPADTRSTFRYEGTATLLNPAALESGDLTKAFLADLPVTLDRRIEVRDTDGRTAVIADDAVLRGRDGTELNTSEHTWAVDRRDLTEREAPEGSTAERHEGLVIAWPLSPERRDYRFWDTGTQQAVPARYDGTETVSGREAHVYDIQATGPLTDPATAGALPAALPRQVVAALVAGRPGPAERPDEAALASLPKNVPLTYVSTTERRGWVDADTGLSLNGSLHQRVLAQTEGPDGPLTLFPVTDVDVTGTEKSVAAQADDAASAGRLLWLLGTGGPLGLLILALLLTAFTVWRARRHPTSRV
ncbi:porin PorA family protein [Streptomyces sp. NPDC057877]|uniref:porin PorA family protein n=1 Tax=Streptomyces sp. NPDC057877 TaxID=3346269 RepID=UPI00368346FD